MNIERNQTNGCDKMSRIYEEMFNVLQDVMQDEDLDIDGIHRGILERALEKLKEGKDRSEIIEETVDALELL